MRLNTVIILSVIIGITVPVILSGVLHDDPLPIWDYLKYVFLGWVKAILP